MCFTIIASQALKGEVVTLEVMQNKCTEKKMLLHKIPGQPLGIQLAPATQAAGAMPVVTVKKVALGSPAHTSGKLWCARPFY